ncbi:MAG: pyridoxamine 5'-phosphate oxidase family protein [Actinomycetota bacterium]
MSTKTVFRGALDEPEVRRFIDNTVIPLKVSVLTESGWPLLCSLWVIQEGDSLLLATQREAKVVQCLLRDPRCAFELSSEQPPYVGIRGRALAEIDQQRGAEILDLALTRYLGDLTSPLANRLRAKVATEVAIVLKPTVIYSWDFTERMRLSAKA